MAPQQPYNYYPFSVCLIMAATSTSHWSLPDEIKIGKSALVLERQPTIFDYNGDTVPDLIVQVAGQLWVLNVDLNVTHGLRGRCKQYSF
jgi:hypothetical protein